MHKYIVFLMGKLKKWLENYLANDNEKKSRKLLRLLDKKRREILAEEQRECSHLAGCHGEIIDHYGRTSIVWHGLNTGEIIGICTNCGRRFFPSDPDYAVWRKRTSFHRISSAGITYSAWGKKSEPYLARDTDLPSRIDMPPMQFKYKEMEKAPDPWLLNPDGSPDPFFANVDFKVAKWEAEIVKESPEEETDGSSTK